MDAMKFLSEAKRMCNNAGPCETCDANEFCGFTPEFPRDFGEVDQLQKMVKLVEKWAEEHPRKTRQREFLQRYPHAKIEPGNGILELPPCFIEPAMYGHGSCRGIPCANCRKKYWMQEVE